MKKPSKKNEGNEKDIANNNGDFKIPIIPVPNSIKPEVFKQFSPQLQVQLNELMEYEKLIVGKLKDPKEKELFINRPQEFFTKHKIKVSPFIERKLKGFDIKKVIPSEGFILPNGEKLVPKININIKH